MTDIYPYGQVAHVTYTVLGTDDRQNTITARVLPQDQSEFYMHPGVVMVLEISEGAPLTIRAEQDPSWEIVEQPRSASGDSPSSATGAYWV